MSRSAKPRRVRHWSGLRDWWESLLLFFASLAPTEPTGHGPEARPFEPRVTGEAPIEKAVEDFLVSWLVEGKPNLAVAHFSPASHPEEEAFTLVPVVDAFDDAAVFGADLPSRDEVLASRASESMGRYYVSCLMPARRKAFELPAAALPREFSAFLLVIEEIRKDAHPHGGPSRFSSCSSATSSRPSRVGSFRLRLRDREDPTAGHLGFLLYGLPSPGGARAVR